MYRRDLGAREMPGGRGPRSRDIRVLIEHHAGDLIRRPKVRAA